MTWMELRLERTHLCVFQPPGSEDTMFCIYQEPADPTHSMSTLVTPCKCLVKSGLTIKTVGHANILQDYATPPPSSIRMGFITSKIM
jgi:hypothetical protein